MLSAGLEDQDQPILLVMPKCEPGFNANVRTDTAEVDENDVGRGNRFIHLVMYWKRGATSRPHVNELERDTVFGLDVSECHFELLEAKVRFLQLLPVGCARVPARE